MSVVLFACTHNAGRSQMAAAFFNRLADASSRAFSAGTALGVTVHPEVVAVMREKGLDLSTATPQLLTADLGNTADVLVTMGCGETCPVLPRIRRIDWPLIDPKGQPLETVRRIRDEIEARVKGLIAELDTPNGDRSRSSLML